MNQKSSVIQSFKSVQMVLTSDIVKIVYEGLTKSEALAMEQMLIKKSSGTGLWNVKDYEPFTNDTDRSMSVQDIQDCFDL